MRRFIITLIAAIAAINVYSQDIQKASSIFVEATDSNSLIIEKASSVVPTANQLAALKNEFTAFIHFGPNTFTRMEWGTGHEDPKIFNLENIDTDQWCKALCDANISLVILTVKHHDGFVLWQSRYTNHGIMSSPFQDGKGDILKELSASCKKHGLKLGIYLSPADLYQIESPNGLYGNLSEYTTRSIPREIEGRPFSDNRKFEFKVDDYNEYFLNQLFELLTEYGEIDEVWFDGAHPKTKGGQRYNYQAWRELIRELAPRAVIFGREDIRWCGNESGATRDAEWNVITYDERPTTAENFPDRIGVLGSREVLLNKEKPFYLHYQPAETNTSIREGWFYRDDTNQGVRSSDDIFDIYERAVGGNSIFLLNIPPNREGLFSERDVEALKGAGEMIRDTYSINLLADSDIDTSLLDDDINSYITLKEEPYEIIITSPKNITFNRLVLQEAIGEQGERVESHSVDAFIDGAWREIADSQNIGYKRILRFADVTTKKIRVRIIETRATPSISYISANYFKTRPPMLSLERDKEGLISITAKEQEFNWKPSGENVSENLNGEFKIYYTIDEKTPNKRSTLYQAPFKLDGGRLQAVAILGKEKGAILDKEVGFIKSAWSAITEDNDEYTLIEKAFDDNTSSYWSSNPSDKSHQIAIDISKEREISGFAYTPQRENSQGMMAAGVFQISDDGTTWRSVDTFYFGNLINDPSQRYHYLKKTVSSRYIRIVASEISADSNFISISEIDIF